MHLVENSSPITQPHPGLDVVGVPLTVVFADNDALKALQARGQGGILLEPPFHVSAEDHYLVLPSDIGVELIDIMRDGDLDLLYEALRDSVVATGTISRAQGEGTELVVRRGESPARLLAERVPYAATVPIGLGEDPMQAVKGLAESKCNLLAALWDEDGLDRVLRSNEYLGVSWRSGAGIVTDPTFVWSRRLSPSQTGVELALFTEYEEMVVLLRPLLVTG